MNLLKRNTLIQGHIWFICISLKTWSSKQLEGKLMWAEKNDIFIYMISLSIPWTRWGDPLPLPPSPTPRPNWVKEKWKLNSNSTFGKFPGLQITNNASTKWKLNSTSPFGNWKPPGLQITNKDSRNVQKLRKKFSQFSFFSWRFRAFSL